MFVDSTAFYDLNTTGLQAEMATNLKPGTECIVAAYDDDDDGTVVFNWHTLSRESERRDPSDGTKVRVFYGKLVKTERLPTAKAAKTEPYSAFFDVLGNFKRLSVVKPSAARRK